MGKFNKGFANLFNLEDEEDDEENKEQEGEGDDKESDEGDDYITQYYQKWGWLNYAVTVKEIKGCTLDEVYEINVVEFLNLISYSKDTNAFEKKRNDEYVKKQRL